MYIKMCDRAEELKAKFAKLSYKRKIGTWIIWRSFCGIIIPTHERRLAHGLRLPERRVATWLGHSKLDIRVVRSNLGFTRKILRDPDLGTPIFDIRLLNFLMDWDKASIPNDAYKKLEAVTATAGLTLGRGALKFEFPEQVWLTAVMSLNYSKVWDFAKEEWVEGGESNVQRRR